MPAELARRVAEIADTVTVALDELLPRAEGPESRLTEAMRYAALGPGKRLRPFFVVETGRMFDLNEQSLLRAACALECIHAYSLVHDDLPCMDDDDLRRGRPTVHKAYDEARRRPGKSPKSAEPLDGAGDGGDGRKVARRNGPDCVWHRGAPSFLLVVGAESEARRGEGARQAADRTAFGDQLAAPPELLPEPPAVDALDPSVAATAPPEPVDADVDVPEAPAALAVRVAPP